MDINSYEEATRSHIKQVIDCGRQMLGITDKMLEEHDATKLESPEKEIFAEFIHKLATVKVGTPEYMEMITSGKLKEAISHHHKHNRHHPEYFSNGVAGMTVMDLLVWVADIMASCKRDNGDPIRSIGPEVGQKRFGYDDTLMSIMINTVKYLQEEKPSVVPMENDSATKIYLDMEFTKFEQGEIISIGLADQYGRTFYAVSDEFDKSLVSSWIGENVLPYLDENNADVVGSISTIKRRLLDWIGSYPKVEIWGDCVSHDWVYFTALLGGTMNLPSHISYIPFDLCTLLKMCGIDPDIGREEFIGMNTAGKHNALHDAKVIKMCCEKCWKTLSFNRT